MTSHRVWSFAVGLAFLSFLSLSGCAIFEPVGDAISQGYENTVAYFNSYYNAKRMFGDAESEILAAQKEGRGRGIAPDEVPVPQSARQKFTTVIDKCSNILSFYPSSNLVDDALFLIGKSYYYQLDYLKAERKFAEMLSQYPNSSIIPQARLWYLKTLNKLKKDSEAEQVAMTLIEAAGKNGDEEIAAEGYAVLGLTYSRLGESDKSLESYRHAVRLSSNDDLRAEVQSRIGSELSKQGKFADASSEFGKVAGFTNERSLVYASRIDEIRALRQAGNFATAIRRCDEMLDDYRFVSNASNIRFERGKSLVASGRVDEGITDLISVDTTASRTELGSRASFELAGIYETILPDYAAARDAYGRALTFPLPDIATVARKHQTALGRYLTLTAARAKEDSLRATVDSVQHAVSVDSSRLALRSINIDSLKNVLASQAYAIGEVFYADLEVPDSAVVWYRRALAVEDSVRTPRIMYILAEISAAHPEKHYEEATTLFRRITEQYPRSIYALRSKVQLGIAVETSSADPGQELYGTAEAMIDAGEAANALKRLRTLIQEYPLSPYAPKSVYTIGWLYEHVLHQPDSALAEYRMLIQTYGASSYALAVRRKIPPPESAAPDSTGESPLRKKNGTVINDEIQQPTREKQTEKPTIKPKEKAKEKETNENDEKAVGRGRRVVQE